jgi:RNA polymerase sigma-B factor
MPINAPHQFPDRPRLTADEEQSLATLRIAGDAAARETLILANLPFALDQAGSFRAGHYRNYIDDLRSIAIAGLIRAVDRYEPGKVSRGKTVRFATYAAHWIKCYLEKATIEDLSTIQIPQWTLDAIRCKRAGKPMPADLDSPESRESIICGELAYGFSARGRAGLEADSLSLVVSRGADDPSEIDGVQEPDPSLARALARLAREHPGDYRVVSLINPIDDSEPMAMTDVGAVIGRHRTWVARFYKRGLAILRRYIEDGGMAGDWVSKREAS